MRLNLYIYKLSITFYHKKWIKNVCINKYINFRMEILNECIHEETNSTEQKEGVKCKYN